MHSPLVSKIILKSESSSTDPALSSSQWRLQLVLKPPSFLFIFYSCLESMKQNFRASADPVNAP